MDLQLYKESIQETSRDIIEGNFSRYPVFIAHQELVKLGEVILDREELGTNFTIQASTLEELVSSNVILPENVEKFKAAYKDPEMQCCIFLITALGARFVFVPYSEAGGGQANPE